MQSTDRVKVNPTCPHCAHKPRTGMGDNVDPTCGRSECQEAEYQANRERNAHRKRKRS